MKNVSLDVTDRSFPGQSAEEISRHIFRPDSLSPKSLGTYFKAFALIQSKFSDVVLPLKHKFLQKHWGRNKANSSLTKVLRVELFKDISSIDKAPSTLGVYN